MAKKPHPGRKGHAIAPLTLDQALGAALRVKLSDVKKLEEAEAKKPNRGTKKRK